MILVLSGVLYRSLLSRFGDISKRRIELPLDLDTLALTVDAWSGETLEIPATTKEYMERYFADDYVSRRYKSAARGMWVDLYIVYCSSWPAGILGHKPTVCLPGHGWIHEGTETSSFRSASGREVPCLIHRFRWPEDLAGEMVVLNYYVVNGRIVTDESAFLGGFGRRPNLAGNPARYISQIQVMSDLESSARSAARDLTEEILKLLPDENGVVKALESTAPTEATAQ